jgi:arginine utilization protein RocB
MTAPTSPYAKVNTDHTIDGPDFRAFLPDVERARELQERLLASAKSAAEVSVGSYEKAMQSLVEFEQRAAEKSPWGAEFITTHAGFLKDMTSVYTNAARELLK